MNMRVHPGDLLATTVHIGPGVDERVILGGVDDGIGHDESSKEE